MSKETGVVLWYRPIDGRGMLKTDSGPRMFFYGDHGLEPVSGLRVRFEVVEEQAGGRKAEAMGHEHGQRNIVELHPTKAKTPKKRAPRPPAPG